MKCLPSHDEPTAVRYTVCDPQGCDGEGAHLIVLEHVYHLEPAGNSSSSSSVTMIKNSETGARASAAGNLQVHHP
jgi:hypothetical protein